MLLLVDGSNNGSRSIIDGVLACCLPFSLSEARWLPVIADTVQYSNWYSKESIHGAFEYLFSMG